MIYPSARTVLLIAAGAPVAVVIGALVPQFWAVGIGWALAILLVALIDALLAPRLAEADVLVPARTEIGADTLLRWHARFVGGRPSRAEGSLSADPRLAEKGVASARLMLSPASGAWEAEQTLVPTRRGEASLDRLWLRWSGPLGLAWRQVVRDPAKIVKIMPNIGAIRSPTFQMFLKDAVFGLITRRVRGEGSEFEALTDYQPGFDKRSIDWKSSGRHMKLLAKEYDTERNNQIVFALDCGSTMCEPVDGLPRIDRAVSAALLTAYVALKAGDRASLFAFGARPEIATPFISDGRNFHRLQEEAAGIDYQHQETNFTLAMSTLAARLQRRSMIVLFTDFHDPTSAELMIESVSRLIDKHLLLFVTIEDEELENFVSAEPHSVDMVAQAVTAEALLNQRRLVITRLKHLGVDVIEARHKDIGTRLIDAYLRVKGRGQL